MEIYNYSYYYSGAKISKLILAPSRGGGLNLAPSPFYHLCGVKEGGASQNCQFLLWINKPHKKKFNNQNLPVIAGLHDHNLNPTKFAKNYP